jgi:hypothetical protein
MELDNALRYQKATVPGCSCRKSDQSWGQALKGAEDMLDGPDTPLSADEAARLSRPATPDPKKPAGAASAAKGQPAPAPTAPAPAAPAPGAPSPTAPAPIAGADPTKPAVGPPPQGVAPDGQRKVRIIAPAPAPANP